MLPRYFGGIAFVSSVFLAPTAALAQQAGLQIAVVRADTGEAVADTDITVENPAIGLRQIERTDSQGLIRLESLSTGGTWQVSFDGNGEFEAVIAEPVTLRSNFARSVTVQLTPFGGDVITVIARRAVTSINTVNAEISASLSDKELQALPIEGRDVIGSLIRLPKR